MICEDPSKVRPMPARSRNGQANYLNHCAAAQRAGAALICEDHSKVHPMPARAHTDHVDYQNHCEVVDGARRRAPLGLHLRVTTTSGLCTYTSYC